MIKSFLRQLKKARLQPSDFAVLLLVTILVIFGIVMVFSASYYTSLSNTGSPYYYLKKQLFFVVLGFIFLFFASVVDYHVWRKYSVLFLVIGLVLLLLLFTPIGLSVQGATRWIRFGPISIMPGEIIKLVAIIFVAAFYASDSRRILSLTKGIIPIVVLMLVIAFLIIKQPNLSTAMTVCLIIIGMMFLAGLKVRYLVLGALVGGGGVMALIILGGKYWADRFFSFLDPFADPLGNGYQVVQSLLALGTGGLFGVGLGKSVQKNLYLPEPQNDFILAIIGEELGLVGIIILLGIYVLLIWRCFHVCLNAPDRFGMLMSGGITIMLAVQVIINVAVATSSMPPTGITLPFISYGGNSLWIFMISMGIILNISRSTEAGESLSKAKKNKGKRKEVIA